MFPFATGKSTAAATTPAESAALLARAPHLREAVDQAMLALVKSLQKMAGAPTAVEGALAGLALREMGEVIAMQTPAWVAGLVRCTDLEAPLVVTVDPLLVHGIVDLLCGGAGRELAPAMPRDATVIDQQFVQIVVALLCGAMDEHWGAYGFGRASGAKLETLTLDVFGPRIGEVGCVDIKISLFGLAGLLRLVLPPEALARFAGGDATFAMQDRTPDVAWSALFHRELGQAPVTLDAYLEAREIDLASLATLQPGQIIALAPDARAQARLVAQGRVLFDGELGQIGDERFSVRIDRIVSDLARLAGTAPTPKSSEPFRL